MNLEIILGVIAVLFSIVWVVLCYKKIIPEPWSKWTLLAVGFIFSLGIFSIFRKFLGKEKPSEPKPVVIDPTPKDEEIKHLDKKKDNLDKEVKNLDKEVKETDEKISKIDERNPDDVLDDDDLNPEFSRRIDELRKKRSSG